MVAAAAAAVVVAVVAVAVAVDWAVVVSAGEVAELVSIGTAVAGYLVLANVEFASAARPVAVAALEHALQLGGPAAVPSFVGPVELVGYYVVAAAAAAAAAAVVVAAAAAAVVVVVVVAAAAGAALASSGSVAAWVCSSHPPEHSPSSAPAELD